MNFAACPVVFCFVFIVIFAIVIANVGNLINNLSLSQESFASHRNWLEQSNVLRIDDSTEHLMFFVQVNLNRKNYKYFIDGTENSNSELCDGI